MMVNAIGFAYSALQGLNLTYQLSSGKYVPGSHIRYIFDFTFDQVRSQPYSSSRIVPNLADSNFCAGKFTYL